MVSDLCKAVRPAQVNKNHQTFVIIVLASYSFVFLELSSRGTLPRAEILSGKNVLAFLVYDFLMKLYQKNILKI